MMVVWQFHHQQIQIGTSCIYNLNRVMIGLQVFLDVASECHTLALFLSSMNWETVHCSHNGILQMLLKFTPLICAYYCLELFDTWEGNSLSMTLQRHQQYQKILIIYFSILLLSMEAPYCIKKLLSHLLNSMLKRMIKNCLTWQDLMDVLGQWMVSMFWCYNAHHGPLLVKHHINWKQLLGHIMSLLPMNDRSCILHVDIPPHGMTNLLSQQMNSTKMWNVIKHWGTIDSLY